MVPTLTLTSILLEPSKGSKTTTYLPYCGSRNVTIGSSFSSEARMPTLPRLPRHDSSGLVGQYVELLHGLALHVHRIGRAEDVDEPTPADVGGDVLASQRNAGEQPRKLAAGMRMLPPLLLENELLCREHGC